MAMKKVLMSVAAAGGMFVVGTSTAHADNVTYTVKAGDTVSEIAEHFDTTVAKIKQLNQLENENLILVGQKLLVTGEQPVNTTNETANNASADTGNTNQAAYQAKHQVQLLVLMLKLRRGLLVMSLVDLILHPTVTIMVSTN